MGATYDDLEGHEGYGARCPGRTAGGGAHLATCSCGWTGGEHPLSAEGYDWAVDDWDRHHARPLRERTLPPGVADLVAEARRALGACVAERPRAVLAAAEGLADWAGDLAGRARAAIGAPQAAHQPGPPAHRRR